MCWFFEEQVDASNCLGISVLAECLDCPELKATADYFIHQHFTEVYKTDEFYNLMSSELHISSTRTLWLWEQRIRFMMLQSGGWNMMNLIASLLWLTSLLKSGFLLKNFLSKTVQAEPLIQDNPECLKMVIIGMRYHPLSPEDREELVEGTRPRRKKHDYRIALFGGSQPQSCRYFNPKVTNFYPCFCF